MAEIPTLPREISPNGKEVWDWASRLSDSAQRAHEIVTLRRKIRNMENQCGSCAHWMTSSCPREMHSNKTGRSTGPSSQALKCSTFAMTLLGGKELAQAKANLEQLAQKEPQS